MTALRRCPVCLENPAPYPLLCVECRDELYPPTVPRVEARDQRAKIIGSGYCPCCGLRTEKWIHETQPELWPHCPAPECQALCGICSGMNKRAGGIEP